MEHKGKPFCVVGGECIGNVPTFKELDGWKFLDQAVVYNLIEDAEWHELDFAEVVDAGAVLVLLKVSIKDETTLRTLIQIKKKDSMYEFVSNYIRVLSDLDKHFQCFVPVSGDKKIEYYTSVEVARIYLQGWYNEYSV